MVFMRAWFLCAHGFYARMVFMRALLRASQRISQGLKLRFRTACASVGRLASMPVYTASLQAKQLCLSSSAI
jgi:hypothetical protein